MVGEVVPVELRPAGGVDEAGRLSRHRLGAELADEAHRPRQRRVPDRRARRTSPRCQPSHRWLSVPSSWGRCGSTPPWATVGRVRVGLLEGALHPAVEHRLVPTRSCWRDETPRPAGLGGRPRVAGASATGSSWAHHCDDRGVVTERRRPPRAAWSNGLIADAAAVAPLQREVLEQQHAELVGGVVQGVGRDVGLDAQGVEAGFDGELDVAAGRRLVRRRRGRGGWAGVGALDEEPLAVDRADPVRPGHLAQSGAAHRRSLTSSSIATLDVDLGRVAGRPGPAATTAGAGEVERQSISLLPSARACSVSPTTSPAQDVRSEHRAGVGRVEAGVQAEVGAGLVGIPAQHARAGGCDRTGVVDADRCATRPPGFQSRSTASECWNSPVMLCRPVVPCSGAQVNSTARRCSSARPLSAVTSKLWGKKYPSGSPR